MMEDEGDGGRVNVSVSPVLPIVVSAAILLFSWLLFPALSFGASKHAIRVGLTDSARILSISSSSPFFLNLPSGKRLKVSERVTVTHRGESMLLNTRVVSASSVSVQGGDGIYQIKIFASVANSSSHNSKNEWNVRGPLEIQNNGSGLTVINRIDLETYVAGVVSGEVSPKWPL